MKIYLLDFDGTSQKKLIKLIEDENLGEVAGTASGWESLCSKVVEERPDVVMADITVPGLQSVSFLQCVKGALPDTMVVVFSGSNDKEMIRQAYDNGAELFLHKPVNETEVKNALRMIGMSRLLEGLLHKVKTESATEYSCRIAGNGSGDVTREADCNRWVKRLRGILQEIGILNETGSRDIIRIISYLIIENIALEDISIRELCIRMGQNPKSLEQRIRRAAAVGISNLAARGMEDYADPIFNVYGRRLFSFEQVKREMDYIRGKSDCSGNVRVKKFLSGIMECCKEEE